MSNYLLDTNHWSYIQRRHPNVIGHIEHLPADAELHMSVIVQAELLSGVEMVVDVDRRGVLRSLYEDVVSECADIIPIDSRIAERFAFVLAQLRRDGHPIATHDIWIAATALVHDLVVVTNDAHFKFVAGLVCENWTESH
jgi:predicted nucleic acid-binding protein